MNARQKGFGTGQMILAITALIVAMVVAFQFNSAVDKTRINEAYRVADEPRLRIAEFYLLSDRFPSSDGEVVAVTGALQSMPDFVREVVLERSFREYDVAVKVYLDHDFASDDAQAPPFVFVAGNRSPRAEHRIEWTCGAHGVAPDLLPRDCVVVDG